MSNFQKLFLKQNNNSEEPAIALVGFGKHPGWYDHIESLGEITPSLVMAKKVLYTEGIGGVIDSGVWETSEVNENNRLIDLEHTFIWQRGSEVIIGKLWASKDKAGRSHYPMVACAHCSYLPFDFIAHTILPQLDTIKTICLGTKNAEEVQAAFAQAQHNLLQAAHQQRRVNSLFASETPPQAFAEYLTDLNNHHGLKQILNYIEQHLGPSYSAKKRKRGSNANDLPCATLRVSGIHQPTIISQSLLSWLWFLRSQLDADPPLLLAYAEQADWCDLFIGQPTAEHLSELRMRTTPLDQTETILAEPFVLRAESVIESMIHPGFHPIPSIFTVNKVSTPAKSIPQPKTQTSTQSQSSLPQNEPAAPVSPAQQTDPQATTNRPQRKPWMTIIGAAGCLATLAVAAFIFLKSPGTPTPPVATDNLAPAQPEPRLVSPSLSERGTLNIDSSASDKSSKNQPPPAPANPPAPNPKNRQAWDRYFDNWNTWLNTFSVASSEPTFTQILQHPITTELAPALGLLNELKPEQVLKPYAAPNLHIQEPLADNLLAKPQVLNNIQHANQRIDHIKKSVTTWPLWSQLADCSKPFEHMQANALSQEIAAYATPPQFDHNLADHIASAVKAYTKIHPAQQALKDLQTAAQAFARYQDPNLNQAWLVYRHTLSQSPTLDTFLHQLTAIQAFNQKLTQFLNTNWATNIDHPNRLQALQGNNRLTDLKDLEAWFTIAQQHTLLPTAQDPRTPQAWKTTLNLLRKQINQLDPDLQATLNPQYAHSEKALQSLLALPLTQANLTTIQNDTTRLAQSLKNLQHQIDDTRFLGIDAWLNTMYGQTFSDTHVQEQWNLYCIQVMGLRADSAQTFKQEPNTFKRKRAWMEDALTHFIALENHFQFPPHTMPWEQQSNSKYCNAFIPYYQLKRQALIEALIPAPDAPPPPVENYHSSAVWKNAVSQFNTQVVHPLQQLATALPKADEHIKMGHPWNDDIAALIYNIKHNPLLPQFTDQAPTSSTLNDIYQYARIHTLETDGADELLHIIADATLPFWKNFAAAQRLTAIDWQPLSIQDSDRTLALWIRLKERVLAAAIPTEPKTQITSILTQQAQDLWFDYAKRLPSHQLHYAFATMPSLGIAPADLPPALQFKQILLQALSKLPNTPSDEATAIQTELISTLQAWSQNNPYPDAIRLISTLKNLEHTPDVNVEKLRFKGPGMMRKWQATWQDAGETVQYTHADHPDLHLKFQLVAVSNRPFYLTTEEVSVGFFFDVLEKLKGRVNATPTLKQWYKKIEQPSSPLRTWTVTNSKPQFANAQVPMQNIPPQIAAAFCKMLSCQLPSPQQWSTLQTSYLTQYKDSNASNHWNLGQPREGVPAANPQAVTSSPFVSVQQHYHPNTQAIPFMHILGNVAEYLQAPNTQNYWVAGGAAIDNSTANLLQPYKITSQASDGYPHIGFRLAFSAPSEIPFKVKLKQALTRSLE